MVQSFRLSKEKGFDQSTQIYHYYFVLPGPHCPLGASFEGAWGGRLPHQGKRNLQKKRLAVKRNSCLKKKKRKNRKEEGELWITSNYLHIKCMFFPIFSIRPWPREAFFEKAAKLKKTSFDAPQELDMGWHLMILSRQKIGLRAEAGLACNLLHSVIQWHPIFLFITLIFVFFQFCQGNLSQYC